MSGTLTGSALPGSAAYREEIARRREVLVRQLTPLFAGASHFTWELGCGHGHFLTAYAQAHPDKLCIGIDIVSERIARATRKRDRARLPNLFFIHAEARVFLDALPAGATFSELFILFPDPWPKLRHQKHRIVQPEFLSLSGARARSSSRICFRTDSRPYFEHARDIFAAHPLWRISDEPWPFEFCTVFQSRAATYHSLIAGRAETSPQ
jgi:tRNA (guanine-N7-)-methyltransferase